MRLLGVLRRDRASLLRTTALQAAVLSVIALPAAAQPAPNAHPMGGQVVGGSAAISQTAQTTTIDQSSQRAAINWQSFDVGNRQTVDFNQPSSSAITLNRVVGPDPSAIAGHIHANGQLVLTNQSGVVFYRGSQVDAQSLVVSAPGITTKNFMTGNMVFDQPAKPGAMVSNAGMITVKQAGLAALVAPQVANSGTINARMGHVVLAGAEAHTVDLYGDGLMSIDVTKQVTQLPRGPDGKPVTALVTNSGLIRADGGTIQLTAKAADGIVQNLVDAGGKIEAASVGAKTGTIAIDGTGGSIVVTGQIEAVGRAPGSTGGQIELDASKTVKVTAGAVVNASGAAGGGVIAVGTTLPRAIGGPAIKPTMTAARTVVQRGARIAADARTRGNGGQVTLLSSGITNFSGTITARGGKRSGNGGNVEISGTKVGLSGGVDVTATHGMMGNITLDPANLTISNTAINNGDLTDNQDPNLAYNTPNTTTDVSVSPSALEALHGNVHLQATDNLTVASSVVLTTPGQNLTLEAGDNLQVNAAVTISTAGTITLSAASSDIPGFNPAGGLSLIRGASVVTSGGSVNLSAGSAGIKLDNSSVAVSSGQTIALNSNSLNVYGISLALDAPAGVIAVAPTTPGLPVQLINTGTAVSGNLVVSQYEIGLMSAATLRLGSSTAGQITIGSGSTDHISLTGVSTVPGGITTLDLETSAGVTELGSLSAGALTGNARSLVSMGVLANTIANLAGFNALGGISLGNTGDITVSGPVTAPDIIAIQTQPNGALSAGNITIGSTLTATDISLIAGSASVASAVSETSAGLINAATLTGAAGSFTIGSPGNSVSSLGSLSAESSIVLSDGVPLTISGPVSAGSSFSASGSGLNLATGGTLDAPATTIDSTGPFTETGNGTLIATSLTGSASSVALDGTGNQLGTLAAFAALSGGLSLTDSTPLSIGGTVSVATDQLLAISDDAISFAGDVSKGLVASSGTVALSPSSANVPLLVFASGTANPTGLSLPVSALDSFVSAGTLQLGSGTTGNITLGNSGDLITIPGSVASTLVLVTGPTGTVSEGGSLTVNALTGNTGAVVLNDGNLVGTLDGFTSSNGFSLTNAQDLTVAGRVADGTGVSLAVTSGNLTVADDIVSPTVRLSVFSATGGSIVQSGGLLSASNYAVLSASGDVTQTGGSIVATALGLSAATATLTGSANSIGTLDDAFTTGNLSLKDETGITIAGFTEVGGTADLLINGPIAETGDFSASVLTGNATSVALLSSYNNIRSLGDFATSSGFSLGNLGMLSVTGTVTDSIGISISTSGTLTTSGTLSAPVITLDALRSTGDEGTYAGVFLQTGGLLNGSSVALSAADGITQSGGSITAGTLTANSAYGAVSLPATGNAVAALGTSSGVGGFTLTDGTSLTIAGPLTDPPSPAVAYDPVSLTSLGNLTIANTVSGPAVFLSAAGAITESSTGAIVTTGSLTGTAGGATSLGEVGNSIAELGSFASGGNFLLSDSIPLTIAGTVSAGMLDTLAIADNSPSFGSGASLIAPGGTVALAPLTLNAPVTFASSGGFTGALGVTASTLQIGSATTGSIDVAAPLALVGPGTLDLVGTAISETGTGALSVATLTGSGTSATLNGNNTITTLGSFSTTGGFSLTNSQSLTVAGAVTDNTGVTLAVATGNLLVASSITAPTVRLSDADHATGGGSIVQTGGTIAATGSLILSAYNAITQAGGGLVTGTLDISDGPAVSLTGASNTVGALGSVLASSLVLNDQSGLAVAGAVVVDGTASLTSTGSISEAAGYGVAAGTLTGSAGAVILPNALNQVDVLGNFTTTKGFTLANSGSLTVLGSVTDGVGISLLEYGTLALGGTLTAPDIGLIAHTGTLFTDFGSLVSPGVISQTGGLVSGAALVSLTADSSIVQSGGAISTGLLEANAPAAVSLTGTANLVADLGSSSSAGGFALADAESLTVTGPVTDPPGISLSVMGDMTIANTVSAPIVYLGATGAITETSTGIVDATTLLTGKAGGATSLGQVGNSIASVGSFSSGGNFLLSDGAPLQISGTVSTGSLDTLAIADDSPSLAAGGFLSAPAGLIAIAPVTPGTGITLAGGGGLGGSPAVNAATLQIGSSTTGPISIAGAFNLTGAGTLDLISHSSITEAGTISAQVLEGTASSAALGTGNSIATLGSFATTGGFSLTNAAPLSVSGPVSDTAVGVAIIDPGRTITVAGSVSGPTVTLSASGVGGAVVQTGGTVSAIGVLVLDGGSIGQMGGAISAGTLEGAAGQVTLTGGTNLIANLGTFAVATPSGQTYGPDFRLDDAHGLTVVGAVTAGGTIALDVTGTGSNLTIANVLAAGPLLDLVASGGTISETAAADASATALTGSAADATLTGINDFPTLAGFTTSSGFTLTNSAPALVVSGPVVDGTSVVITEPGMLTVAGTVSAPDVTLNATPAFGTLAAAGVIDIAGAVVASSAAALNASGSIAESGSVTAGTLTGSSGGTTSLAGVTNTIADLGSFASTGAFALGDATALAVTGTVSAPTISLALGGALTETSSGAILTPGALTGTVAGAASLGQSGNSIVSIGSFASSGNVLLADSAALTVAGTVSTGSLDTLTLADDHLSFAAGGLLIAPSGTVALEPLTSGDALSLGGGSGFGSGSAVSANTLQIGSTSTGPITVTGPLDLTGANTLDLVSGASIAETGSGAIAASVLDGAAAAGSATLNGANSIATLGSFTTDTGFSLTNAAPLSVTGPVSDAAVGVSISDPGHVITLLGSVAGPTVTLSAAGIGGAVVQTGGTVSATGVLTLDGGSIGQTGGALVAGTLVGAAGQVTLDGGTNLIANLGSFAVATPSGETYAADFRLYDARSLTVVGSVTAGGSLLLDVTGSGDLTIANGLAAGSLLDLVVPGGTISETAGAGVSAALLEGQAQAALLTGINNVATLAEFYGTNGLTLTNSGPTLTTAAQVRDGTEIVLTEPGTLLVAGNVAAPSVVLSATPGSGTLAAAGVIDIAGAVVASSAAALNASGSIAESGSVTAGTLTGSSGGTTSLAGVTNTIADLGSFASTGAFALGDATALAVTGTVDAPTISLAIGGALTETSSGAILTPGALTGTVAGAASLGQSGNSIVSIGSFASSGNVLLADSAAFTVVGTVSAGSLDTLTLADDHFSFAAGGLLIAPSGTAALEPLTSGDALSLGGGSGFGSGSAVSANTLQIGSTSTGPISIAGALDLTGANTLDLASASAISETTGGAIAAPTLIGQASAATLTGDNAIATLGSFATTTGFALTNAQNLTVVGPVVDTSSGVRLELTSGSLTLDGTISGPTVSLSALGGGIAQPAGLLSASSIAYLDAAGPVTQSGSAGIVAGTLELLQTGGSGVAMNGTGNTIANLASIDTPAGNFSLVDQTGVNISGAVGDPTSNVTLTVGGSLSIGSYLQADQLDLTAAGDITAASGTLRAGTLTGSGASFMVTGPFNYVGTLGDFTTNTGFALADHSLSPTVSGAVRDGVGITLATRGTLSVTGTFAAPSVGLSAAAYTGTYGSVAGVISQSAGLIDGSATVNLAAGNAILQTGGSLVAGTLSGSSGGLASLSGTANGIAALGSFTAGGALTLADARALTITGVVSAPEVSLFIGGSLSEPGGMLSTGLLIGTASGASLGQIGNSIATLGSFASAGGFLLTDGGPVTISGGVSAGPGLTLTLADDAPSFGPGGSLVVQGGTVVLTPVTTGDALMLGGGSGFGAGSRVTANTLQIGSSSAGAITITGALDLTGANTLDLVSGAAITESGSGAVAAPVLAASGTAATLNGANAIGTLANIGMTGSFALTNAGPLVVAGTVQAGIANAPATLGFDVAGALAIPGTIAGTGAVTLVATGAMAIGGQVSGSSVGLTTAGILSESSSGRLSTGTLTGSVGSAELGGSNTIVSLGSFAAASDLTLNDVVALTIAGPVTATTATLADGPGITFAGNLSADTLTVNATSPIVQSTGTLNVGTLTGIAGSLAQFGPDAPGPAAYVGTLGPFSVTNAGTLVLTDAEPLVVDGPLSAADIAISAPGAVTLAGGTITTDGLPVTQQSLAQPSLPGSYIAVLPGTGTTAQLLQAGTTTIQPLDGTTATVRLDAPGSSGTINLNDLVAPTTNLVLAAPGGVIAGTLDVASLTVLGETGSATLSGTVNGIGGTAAAPISAIAPGVNVAYTINGCVIMTTCGPVIPVTPVTTTTAVTPFSGVLPSTIIPGELLLTDLLGGQSEGATPLRLQVLFGGLITIIAPRDYEDPDVLLPNISDRDY